MGTKEIPDKFELDSIRTCKIPGAQLGKSFVVDGMVIPRSSMGNEKQKYGCKVAVYGSGIDFQQTEAKLSVRVSDLVIIYCIFHGRQIYCY